MLPLTQVYPILFAMPLLITVLAIPILGERVGLHRAAAILVGLIGVLVVLRPGSAALSLGHAAALAGAVFSALSSIIMRKIGREERTVVLQLYPLLVNLVLMGALLPFVYVPVAVVDLGASAVMAALALSAIGCLVAAYRLAPAMIVAPMQYSQIVWATLFGAVFFGERLDTMTMVGTGIIIAAGLYIVLREDRRAGTSSQPVLRTRSRAGTPGSPRVAAFLEPHGSAMTAPATPTGWLSSRERPDAKRPLHRRGAGAGPGAALSPAPVRRRSRSRPAHGSRRRRSRSRNPRSCPSTARQTVARRDLRQQREMQRRGFVTGGMHISPRTGRSIARASDEGIGVAGQNPGLLRLLAGIHLDHQVGAGPGLLRQPGQRLGQLGPVQRVDRVERAPSPAAPCWSARGRSGAASTPS